MQKLVKITLGCVDEGQRNQISFLAAPRRNDVAGCHQYVPATMSTSEKGRKKVRRTVKERKGGIENKKDRGRGKQRGRKRENDEK